MKTTKEQIVTLLNKNLSLSVKQMRTSIGVSESLIHRHLKKLLQEQKIGKKGSPPVVHYFIKTKKGASFSSQIIKNNWLEIEPNGAFVYGEGGFEDWCSKRQLDQSKMIRLFEADYKTNDSLKRYGCIDATQKLKKTFSHCYLEKIYYIDFYSLPIFGKTLLGKLILYAKQNSDIVLMKDIAKRIQKPLQGLIDLNDFDMIAVIPHSVPRKRNFLNTTLSFISGSQEFQKVFQKVFCDHPVAQKTLKSKQERELNAEQTLVLIAESFPLKILLIDDACGSGATLNIAAKKIKAISPSSKIMALTFVGSQKGFDVLAEV
jgi:predicted amidophosphoribosyltransferase